MSYSDQVCISRVREKEVAAEAIQAAAVFPGKIRGLREAQGLTLREVHEDTGIDYRHLNMYENGVIHPNFVRLAILAGYYGVSVDWLMGRDY